MGGKAAWIEGQKEAALVGRPKSREETPKEGCNIDTQRSMLQCTMWLCAAPFSRGQVVAGVKKADLLSRQKGPAPGRASKLCNAPQC